ncbi:MAG: nicotinate-nucleotide diphosphorylase (carboxylating), partial [Verrucomicrobia bacterium]
METLSADEIRRAVQQALAEDIGSGDVTTLAVVPETALAAATMVAREPLIVAGLAFAEIAFQELSAKLQLRRFVEDGQRVAAAAALLRIAGPARAILTAERVA